MTDAPDPLVLLAISDAAMLDEMTQLLQDDYRICIASSGQQVLQMVQQEKPALIMLDTAMSDVDSLTICRQIKTQQNISAIHVIFVTMPDDDVNALAEFEAGTVDYVTRPVCPSMVRSRVRTHVALKLAQEELEQNNFLLMEEKNMMENIVNKMRSDHHFDERGLKFFSYSEDKTNGDLVLSAYCDDGHQYILVGDFTGHGLPASVCGPLVYYIYYSMIAGGRKAEAILHEINAVLCKQLPPNLFMAAVMFDITPERDRVRMWNAGMPPILEKHERRWEKYDPTSMALGICEDVDFSICYSLQVDADDMFYMYSDGVIEAINEEGEMFELERLKRTLGDLVKGDIELADILDIVKDFATVDFPLDDTTLVEVTI